MANPCYSGPNPITDKDRMAIWKWAKENAIDKGLPFDKVHDAINEYFFGNQAKPEWINDVLSGRKTPFRQVAADVWKKQYNRRAIVQQATALYRDYNTPPAVRWWRKALEFPRSVVTFGHGIVFPITHGGDLMLRPESWGPMLRNTYDNWTKSWSKEQTARIMDSMRRDPLYDIALQSGLDIGKGSHPSGILSTPGGAPHPFNILARAKKWSDEQSERSWQYLTKLRFDVWKQQMEEFANPATMSHQEMLDYGKSFADWANHATGTVKVSIPHGAEIMFGPKLTASKISRFVGDPIKTASTILGWKTATPGERAVAITRAWGAAQYLATGMGFLALNQAVLHLFGSKQTINVIDPTKSDFMKFKGFGVEASQGGLHTEAQLVGKLLALSWADEKVLKQTYPFGQGKMGHLQSYLTQYISGKLAPTIQRGEEALTGENFMGRPLPWNPSPGTPSHPKMSWGEFLGSIGPIPLSGLTRYLYDEFRKRGSTVSDSASIIKALIITGLSGIGMHAAEEKTDAKPMRARHERAQLAR
jgi:hypothetical protein